MSLLHPTTYYTLNNIPTTSPAVKYITATKVVDTPNDATTISKPNTGAMTFESIKPLLVKNTCFTCHDLEKKLVGPPFKDIAKRKYSAEKIVELIYKPQKKNWPEYATEMAPMPQVPRSEAMQIGKWISTLK